MRASFAGFGYSSPPCVPGEQVVRKLNIFNPNAQV